MSLRLSLAAAAALTALALPVAAQDHPPGLHVHDAYARIGASGSGAVFFLIHNNTETDDTLTAAATDIARRVELHTHIESADGVMQMVEIEDGIELPAGEMHEFARGGDHVMLMGLSEDLADGATFPLTLTFEEAGEVVVEVVVDNDRAPDAGHGDGHDHGTDHGAHGHGG